MSLGNELVVWLSFMVFLLFTFLPSCYLHSLREKIVYLQQIGLAYLTMEIEPFKIMWGSKLVHLIQIPLQQNKDLYVRSFIFHCGLVTGI